MIWGRRLRLQRPFCDTNWWWVGGRARGRIRGEALLFPHSKSIWRDSVVMVKHRTAPFISTELEEGRRIVQLHQDGNSGRPRPFVLDALPRTVLATATRADGPTVALALARKEMRSWMQLQLEPSAMRAPSCFRRRRCIGLLRRGSRS